MGAVRISEFRGRDTEHLEIIDRLLGNPAYQALREDILAARDAIMASAGKKVLRGNAHPNAPVPAELDQRWIDQQRGFWAGAVWALDVFPRMTAKQWETFTKESE